MKVLMIFLAFCQLLGASEVNYNRAQDFSEAGESKFERLERVEKEIHHLFQEAKLNQKSRTDLNQLSQKLGPLEHLLTTLNKVKELESKIDQMSHRIKQLEEEVSRHHRQDITIEN